MAGPEIDSRYELETVLGDRGGRFICIARDRLTGASRVVKRDATERIVRELMALLVVPRGVAPRPLDVFARQDGTACLVLERLGGETLLAAAPRLAPSDLPRLIARLCDRLESLHAAGLVHADLKPANVFLVDRGAERETPDVRLIDLGASFGHFAGGVADDPERVGTPPFLAPEIAKRWNVDARADQYSLGMTLRVLFPRLEGDDAWRVVIERLCESSPARRYADIRAVREDLARRFALGPSAGCPRFPFGPMEGRADEVRDLLDRIATGDSRRILVQARPRTGLTRLLLEVAAVAVRSGHPVRVVDLGGRSTRGFTNRGSVTPRGADRLSTHDRRLEQFVEQCVADGQTVLCGVSDPSPALTWLPAREREALAAMLARGRWARNRLRPLDTASFVEIVCAAEGGGPRAVALGRALHLWSAGDLDCAARALEALGPADGCHAGEALARLDFAPPPAWSDTPADLRTALGTAARAGGDIEVATMRELLRAFAHPGDLDALLDRGLLEERDGRLSFITPHLLRSARSVPTARANEIEGWLHRHLVPDPDRPGQIIEASLRARALGDRPSEAHHLSAGLERARLANRWDDVLDLLAYPDPAPVAWTFESVRTRSLRLAEVLGPEWPPERVVMAASAALKSRDLPLAVELWEGIVATRPNDALASEALVLLVEHDLRTSRPDAYADHMGRLEDLAARGMGPDPGVLDLKRAWHALGAGRPADAETYARAAVKQLRGTGSVHESLSLQQFAVLRMTADPSEALELMHEALAAARTSTQAAQVHYNLALMHAHASNLEACAVAAEAGIARLRGRDQPRLEVGLREQRAWAWSAMDRIPQAWEEAESLAQQSVVRNETARAVIGFCLSGFCALHQGADTAALSDLTRAWEMSQSGCPPDLRATALRYLVDGLLDLEAWELCRELGARLESSVDPDHPDVLLRLGRARARALRAQACRDFAEAIAVLGEAERDARNAEPEWSARYFHHLGCAHLAVALEQGSAEEARRSADRFRESLAILPGTGYGYFRARTLLGLARAERVGASVEAALVPLDDAIHLARAIGSRRLLAEGLKVRANWSLDEVNA